MTPEQREQRKIRRHNFELAEAVERDMQIQRRLLKDPTTQAYVDTILGQLRGRDRAGNPLFRR